MKFVFGTKPIIVPLPDPFDLPLESAFKTSAMDVGDGPLQMMRGGQASEAGWDGSTTFTTAATAAAAAKV